MSDALEQPAGVDQQSEDNLRGIMFLCAGVFIFSFQDIIIKLLSSTYPVHQIVFIRGFLALPLLLIIVHHDSGLETLKTKKPVLHVLRSLAMFCAYLFFYLAAAAVPLTTAVALFFTAPLMITALSIVVLGEKVGWRRWAGVIVGFVGVLIILRPGLADIEPAGLFSLAAALAYTLAQLIARRLGVTDSASVMAFYSMLAFTYLGAGMGFVLGTWGPGAGGGDASDFLLRGWVMPGGLELAMLITVGVISAMGFYLLSQAYRLGEANTVAPFEFTSMIWAMILSFAFLASVPDMYTFIGAAIVGGAGIYVLRREGIKRRKPLAARGILRGR
jgi:drug/metabolite transporter (DMT)-like permease